MLFRSKVEDYVDIHNKLLKINPSIKISSDFIVGYPGEEKIDFEETIQLVKNIKFINSFSFIFSPRPGTIASKMSLINKEIALQRLEKVQKELFNNQIEILKLKNHI